MKKNIPLLVVAMLLALGLFSCQNDDALEAPMGKVIGKVTLYDIQLAELADKSGVTVEAHTGERVFTTRTNNAGEFAFDKLPLGSYIINFQKENFKGFDSLRYEHQNQVDSLFFAELVEIPEGRVTINRIYTAYGAEVENPAPVHFIFPMKRTEFASEETMFVSIWQYFSKQRDVSSTNFKLRTIECCSGGNYANPLDNAALGIEATHFYEKGFAPGDSVYVVAYLANKREVKYDNPATGYHNFSFPTHRSKISNVVGFVLP